MHLGGRFHLKGRGIHRSCKYLEFKHLYKPYNKVEAVREVYPCDSGHIQDISSKPLLLTVAENDRAAPTDLLLDGYSKSLEPKQFQILPCGHFDP